MMMKKSLFIFLVILCVQTINTKIIETCNIADVLSHIDGPETVVVFDIDNTLIKPESDLGGDQWFMHITTHIMKNMNICFNEALKITLPFYFHVNNFINIIPVEPITPHIIQLLNAEHIPTLALTTRSLPFKEQTNIQLTLAGIHFSHEMLPRYEIDCSFNCPALYSHGIIFAGNNDKGTLLLHMLNFFAVKPKKIIFVDDKMKNIISVEDALKKKNIAFTGIRYARLDSEVARFNADKAEQELYFLYNNINIIWHTAVMQPIFKKINDKLFG